MLKELLMSEIAAFTRTLKSPPDDVGLVHELLNTVWEKVPDTSKRDRFSFETALVELASNVIEHADDGDGVTYTITIKIHADEVEAEVVDSGKQADVELEDHSMPDAHAESGRGIPLIMALVDHFSYDRTDGLNIWNIRRKFKP